MKKSIEIIQLPLLVTLNPGIPQALLSTFGLALSHFSDQDLLRLVGGVPTVKGQPPQPPSSWPPLLTLQAWRHNPQLPIPWQRAATGGSTHNRRNVEEAELVFPHLPSLPCPLFLLH